MYSINTELICIDYRPNNLHSPILSTTETYIVESIHDLGYIKLQGIDCRYNPNRFVTIETYNKQNNREQELQERIEIINNKNLKDRIYDKTRRKRV